ncbi:hypothetical protein F5X97DRAFT_341326 [Nemania serpens]|nr:hypothetical protein F5X97DRAFT_341326 [Nemania serpens]
MSSLKRFIYVEPHSDSISYLKDESNNSINRRLIRKVQVRLTSYHSALAKDLALYAYCQPRAFADGADPIDKILKEWEQATAAPSPEFQALMKTYQAGHALYKKRYADHKELLETGQFVKAITEALAKFPNLEELEFRDSTPASAFTWDQLANNPPKLSKCSVMPMGLLDMYKYGLEPEISFDIAVKILADMATTKSTIKELTFFPETFNISMSVFKQDILRNLRDTAKQLEKVVFDCGEYGFQGTVGGEAEFHQFMSAILDTDSLVTISVCPRNLERSDPIVGLKMPHAGWPKLESLYLNGVSMDGDELVRLADSAALQNGMGKEMYVELYKLNLTGGSWSKVFESLREKAAEDSAIKKPLGAEDTMPAHWHSVALDRLLIKIPK